MVLLAHCFLHYQLVLSINILSFEINVKFIILLILLDHLGPFHVETDGQNSAQGEIWILNIFSVHLFILVQQVRVFELLNRLVRDLRHPVVDSQTAVL